MNQPKQPELPDEEFFASKQGLGWKHIAYFWGIALMCWLPLFPRTRVCEEDIGTVMLMGLLLGLVLVGFSLWEWIESPRKGQPLVTLREDAIESSLFELKSKRIQWLDIGEVIRISASVMEFRRSPASIRPIVKNVWYGGDDSNSLLELGALAPEDRTRLLNSIERRLSLINPDARIPAISLATQFSAANRIEAMLTTLAPTPWLTYVLVLVNVSIWISMVHTLEFPYTIAPESLLHFGGNATYQVLQGEWWRLLTGIFLHSSVPHLGANMIALLFLGPTTERLYGRTLFILIYVCSGLVGSSLSLHFGAQTSVSIGASGAILGVGGAATIGVLRNISRVPQHLAMQLLGINVALVWASVLSGFVRGGIDNAVHLGGLVAGCVLAATLPDRLGTLSNHGSALKPAISGLVSVLLVVSLSFFTVANDPLNLQSALTGRERLTRLVLELGSTKLLVRQELVQLSKGSLSVEEVHELAQRSHISIIERVATDLGRVTLLPNDPGASLVEDARYMTTLMLAILATPYGEDSPQAANLRANIALVTDSIAVLDKAWIRVNDSYGKLVSEIDAKRRPKCMRDR